MERRNFIKNLAIAAGAFVLLSVPVFAEETETPRRRRRRRRKFAFKVKTEEGNVVGGIVIEASDVEAAKVKLRERYRNSVILEAKEKE